ncbi:MAG: homoserine dehydrogenase [Anaerolineales bacterium]
MSSSPKKHRLALLGFGNVGQAFARLLLEKENTLKEEKGVVFQVTGIATGSHGRAIDPAGIDLEKALSLRQSGDPLDPISTSKAKTIRDFIQECPADTLFESTPVNYQTGQPALDYLQAAIQSGMHVITANKGPMVHGYRKLVDLATSRGRSFLFEATVMDGAPVFSIARCGLPAADITGIQGILNSTTNLILTRMEQGQSQEEAVAYAQSMGIAETDPSGDLDGWDAAVKMAILVNVLMKIPLKLSDVDRSGIREINQKEIKEAAEKNKRWKLICSAQRQEGRKSGVLAQVQPRLVEPSSPLYHISGTSALLQVESDVLGTITLQEEEPTPMTTAYGFLADLLNVVKNKTSSGQL